MDVTQAQELVERTLYPLLVPEYQAAPMVGMSLCEVLPWDPALTYGERLDSVTDFGEPEEVAFGTELPERSAVSGWKVYAKTRKIGHKVTIERELFEAEAANGRLPARLQGLFIGQGEAFARKIDKHIAGYVQKGTLTAGSAKYFDNSFPGEADPYPTVGYDGVPLFDTAHVLKLGAATPSNHTATAALNSTTLEAALVLMEHTSAMDERGEQISNRMDTLLVPKQLEVTAQKLIASELLPGGGNNDINPFRNRFTVATWDQLTDDTDAWFLARLQSGRRTLRMRDSGLPRVGVYYRDDIHCYVIEAFKYFSLTHQDWRGMFCANKAAS